MEQEPLIIYDKNTIEFVTVAIQYCKFIENAKYTESQVFVDKTCKLIPLLYLKASMLPEGEFINEELPEIFVTEYDYEYIRMNLAEVIGADDDYLDVFSSEMSYSDMPLNMTISEDLADIYQDVKNFISVYEIGLHETMHDALLICKDSFETFWGQKAVNVMRPLHAVRYREKNEEE